MQNRIHSYRLFALCLAYIPGDPQRCKRVSPQPTVNRNRDANRVRLNWTGNLVACSTSLGYPHRTGVTVRTPLPTPSNRPFDRESRNPRLVSRFGSPLENRENSPLANVECQSSGGRGPRNCLRTDAKPIGVSNRVAINLSPFAATFSRHAISTVDSCHSFPHDAHAIGSSFSSVVPSACYSSLFCTDYWLLFHIAPFHRLIFIHFAVIYRGIAINERVKERMFKYTVY